MDSSDVELGPAEAVSEGSADGGLAEVDEVVDEDFEFVGSGASLSKAGLPGVGGD